jgi:tetratricopeptide (TPR) repeat protein
VALGIGYLEKRQFANADKELRRAISDDPRSAAAPYALAVGLLRQGLPASAIDPLLLCVRRDPDYLEAYFELARAYRRAGAPEESIDVYRRLLARRPDHVEAHWELANLLKYLFDVTTFRIESLRGSPQPPPEGVPPQALLGALVERADQYQELALSELTISLRLRPGDPRAIHHVADLHRRSGRLREAAGLFEWLARTQSDEWLYHHRLGTTLIELGEDNRALAALAQASRLAPSQGDVYAAIGFAHLKQQRLEQAIEMLDKAKVFLPFSPALYTNLGVAYALQGSFDVARRHLRRAVALGTFPLPRLHLTFTNLGLVELRDGHPEEAITAFETALHLAPGYVPAANLLTKTRSNPTGAATWSRPEAFVVNDMLEIFGEISTVALDD